jgi:DNA-binding transcriptional LysR family regulator
MLAPRDLPLLAVFAAIARNSSFTGAARELGFTKSMVSAQLRKLESKLGVTLVERTTRSLRLTSAGAAAWAAAQRMLDEAQKLEAAVALHHAVPAGRLRVGVPHGLGASVVAPLSASLVREHATLAIDLVIDDALGDLVRDDLDVVVRLAAPRDSTYVMHRLGSASVVLVAAPWLGIPLARRPSELEGAPWVRHTLLDRDRLTFTGPGGQKESVKPLARASANTMEAFRALLMSGAGVGAIPDLHVLDELSKGTLVCVCPGWTKRRLAVHALVRSRDVPAHVALFLSALRGALAPAR